MRLQWIAIASAFIGFAITFPIERRAACTSYTLINTRGTWEDTGESGGFKTMNVNILAQVPGGKIYNTNYPAGLLQLSYGGTEDIVNHINETLAQNPDECFILQGYSQGAAATVNALPRITGASYDAVKGVFLIGDPKHKPDLTCNWDNFGGITTRDSLGAEAPVSVGIPANWVIKTMDVCMQGDNICDLLHASPAGGAIHGQYPYDVPTQNLGTQYCVQQLYNG